MNSRWDETDARRFQGDIELRVYSSRLLGSEAALVLHGGGNTSVKTAMTDRFGDVHEALVVKGSGSDLATVEAHDFTPVKLHEVARLLSLPSLANDEMMDALATCVLRAGAPRASIETLLHASLPFKYVEHTHADSVLAVTNTANGAAIAAQLFGELAPLVPFHASGFELAKACEAVFRAQATPRTIGLILLHHGVVAFGNGARESYENMLALVTRAERYLAEHRAWALPERETPLAPWEPQTIARLRRDISRAAGFPLVLAAQDDPVWRGFAARPDLEALCREGPATPQHAVFAKRTPMLGLDVGRYAAAYRDYVAGAHAGASPADLGLDAAPRVVIDAAIGTWTAGITAPYADVTAQIFRHDLEIMSRAQAHDRYAGLPDAAILDAEVHYGGFERRLRERGDNTVALLGEVGLVVGAPSALRDAVLDALQARGAAVATTASCERDGVLALSVEEQPTQADIAQALRTLVAHRGGLDVLLLLPGASEAWTTPAGRLLALAPRQGRIVVAQAQTGALGTQARLTAQRHGLAAVRVLSPAHARAPAVQARLIAELCEPALAALQPTVELS